MGGLKGALYERLEVVVLDVENPLKARYSDGEDSILIRLRRLLDTVARAKDNARELSEFLLLVEPRASPVAVEGLELSKLRIGVSRKHLSVGVNFKLLLKAHLLDLLEEFVEGFVAVAGNEYAVSLGSPG